MIALDLGQANILAQNGNTATYSSLDWDRITHSWRFTMYTTAPGTDEPVDKPSTTYSPRDQAQARPWDEVMEEVLQDRAEAWEILADL
jgi:hypothetical protein